MVQRFFATEAVSNQVDENMARAQRRDAIHTQKFYFRKDVFPPGVPSPIITPESSGTTSPIEPNSVDGIPRRKERKLRNCFAAVPPPENGHTHGPVEDEYEESTLDEMINGKVHVISYCRGG